jgi:hypothetical protein
MILGSRAMVLLKYVDGLDLAANDVTPARSSKPRRRLQASYSGQLPTNPGSLNVAEVVVSVIFLIRSLIRRLEAKSGRSSQFVDLASTFGKPALSHFRSQMEYKF